MLNFATFWSLSLTQRLSVGISLLFGSFLILSPVIYPPDRYEDLVPAEGPLLSYSLFKGSGRNSSTDALFKLGGYPGRFWNEELQNGLIQRLDGKIGTTIHVMYQPHDRFAPLDGDAVKSYGLSIDGEQFASAEDAVNFDRSLSLWVIPTLGIGILGLAYWQFRKAVTGEAPSSSSLES